MTDRGIDDELRQLKSAAAQLFSSAINLGNHLLQTHEGKEIARMASVFRRKGQQAFHIKWRDALGRWHSDRTPITVKEAALALAQRCEDAGRRVDRDEVEEPSTPEMMTVEELVQWWLDTFSARSRSHASNVSRMRSNLFGTHIAEVPVDQLRSSDVTAYLHELAAGKSPQSVFNKAIEHGKLPEDFVNPVSKTKKHKQHRHEFEWLRSEEVPMALHWISPRWKNVLAVCIFTGCRKGEAFGLRKRDVDLKERTIRFQKSWEHDSCKNGETRTVPIVEALVPYLESQLAKHQDSELLFPGPTGGLHRKDVDVVGPLRTALRKCGLEHRAANIRLHDMRHTAASVMLNAGVPMHVVSRVLGHKDPQVTAQIYGHILTDTVRSEMERAFSTKRDAA